jgi:hypothetical protein
MKTAIVTLSILLFLMIAIVFIEGGIIVHLLSLESYDAGYEAGQQDAKTQMDFIPFNSDGDTMYDIRYRIEYSR